MDNFGRILYGFIEKEVEDLELYFNDYKNKSTKNLPEKLVFTIYPDDFLSNKLYLVFPQLFQNIFKIEDDQFINKLCLSGYFYFKYLIELDDLIDQDTNKQGSVASLRANHYYFESNLILSSLFKDHPEFWNVWRDRLNNFYTAIMIDKTYDPNISIELYESLALGKCSFSLLAIDGLLLHSNTKNKSQIFEKLEKALNFYFISRCIQDDFDDFFKDLKNRKNNFAHSLLFKKLDELGINTLSLTPYQLERLFYEQGVAEDLLDLCSNYLLKASNEINEYKEELGYFISLLKLTNAKIHSIQGQSKYKRIITTDHNECTVRKAIQFSLEESIKLSYNYLLSKQRIDGAWEEVTNKQGISDVWSTAFIASFLDEHDQAKIRAVSYLKANRKKYMWGYNSGWLNDYDSTTFALLNTVSTSEDFNCSLDLWLNGQVRNGGFKTYDSNNKDLKLFLGLQGDNVLSGWGSSHPCVSAAALYLLTYISKPYVQENFNALVNYLKSGNEGLNLEPYWWSSKIYSYYFYIKAMYRINGFTEELEKLLNGLFNDERIFKVDHFVDDILAKESVFYTGLVLELLTLNKEIYSVYKDKAYLLSEYIIQSQNPNGSFENTLFQIIPETNEMVFKNNNQSVNSYGGTNSITGEFRSLFSSAVAFRSLTNYFQINLN
ncbi:hypothetical protein [Marivirga sp.]|uniref:hypothetical protein n=1 Tax=Marivirga sp. TaxID=2018662 RepID=UPI003DA738F3